MHSAFWFAPFFLYLSVFHVQREWVVSREKMGYDGSNA